MKKVKDLFKEYLTITAAVLLVAAGIYFFKFPNHFSTGGVSGISVILGALFPRFSNGDYVMAINIILLILGMILLGKGFCFKTVYCSLLMSLSICVFEKIFPMTAPLTDQPMLELVYSILFPAVGSAILFYNDASTGGTDILAMILKKYTGLNIGRALFCTDFIIAGSTIFVFGIKIGLFSLLGLLAKSLVVDNVIESISISKFFVIITSHQEEIREFINTNLHKGATICECSGAYSEEKFHLILTAVNRAQAKHLKEYIKSVDKHSFVVITNSFDIIGKGFREYL